MMFKNYLSVKGSIENLLKFEEELKKIGYEVDEEPKYSKPNKSRRNCLTFTDGVFAYYKLKQGDSETIYLSLPEDFDRAIKLAKEKESKSFCECGCQKDHDCKYCTTCNKFHSI